jgi:hypothetical protein
MRHENRFEPDISSPPQSSPMAPGRTGPDLSLIAASIVMAVATIILAVTALLGAGPLSLWAGLGLLAAGVVVVAAKLIGPRRARRVDTGISQSVLDAIKDPFAVTGEDHELVACNAAYRRLMEGRPLATIALLESEAWASSLPMRTIGSGFPVPWYDPGLKTQTIISALSVQTFYCRNRNPAGF